MWLFQVFFCITFSSLVASQNTKNFENAPSFPIPLLDYNDLALVDESTSAQLLYTLSNLGIIAISNIPGYKEARVQALSNLENNCLDKDNGADIQTSLLMADGSTRRTAGTSTKSGRPNTLSTTNLKCDRSTTSLRTLVDLTSRALFNSLDLATGRNDDNMKKESISSLMDSSTSSSSYKTLNTLISNAEHLEHFHQYEQTKQQQQKIQDSHPPQWSPALRMHTDSGLLIGMTSGYHSSVETGMNENNNGLYIELPQGGVYQVSCPDDALIFMVGQGGASWFNSESGLNLRAVPHALILPWEKKNNNDNGIQKLWRSWYGRMFLPPADALVPSSQEGVLIPFQELRSHQIEMVTSSDSSSHDYASIGCGHGIHHPSISKSSSLSSTTTTSLTDIPSWLTSSSNLRHDDQHQHHRLTTASVETTDDGCGSDAVLCWMQCMDSTSMSCGVGTSIACFDEGSGEVVAGDIMCPTGTDNCELKCVADSLLEPPIDHKGFCYGSGTDMYMDGFTSYINNDDTPQCLNLLFTDWILDNSGKFVAACIGTLLLGIFTEMLGYIRRLIDSFIKSGGFGTYKRAAPLVMSTLYGIQVLMGYFLMLTAMTYQVELFICVIVGLMMGHAAFNLQEPPSANTDPCCVGRVSSDKSHDYKGLHTTLPLTNNLEESIVASPMYQDGDKMLLGVDGMTCSSCTSTVKTALEKMRGVVQVEVNLGNTSTPFGGRASIRTEGDGVSAQSCIATIESVGFNARLI